MKAIGFKTSLPINEQDRFFEFDTAMPIPGEQDLLVKIGAVSVNPIDFKVRSTSATNVVLEKPKIIGWDAAGVVEAIGQSVTLFKAGDLVYYSGDITRPGCNAEFQLIDERITGKKPVSLSLEESAVLPLTSVTAWETLFHRMRIDPPKDHGKSILIIGGGGGVGSIAIQLAKKVAGLTVLATASRPETSAWCKQMGADFVVDHKDLVNEVRKAGFREVDFIVDFVNAGLYWDAIVELIKPQGHIGSIADLSGPVDLLKFKAKSVSFSWESMFTRSRFQTPDMIQQHYILNELSDLVDKSVIKTTLNNTLHGMTVENFKHAHKLLESGKAIGKIAIKY